MRMRRRKGGNDSRRILRRDIHPTFQALTWKAIGDVRCQKPAETLHPCSAEESVCVWSGPDEHEVIFYFYDSVRRWEPVTTMKWLGLT
jgi:hypothetical protein